MSCFIRGCFLLLFLNAADISGICQLRNLSNYGQDCINTGQTYFILHDTGSAEFGWATEWTHFSANNYSDKTAMVIWHFKNGLKAYSQVIEVLGDAGQITGYFLTGKSSNLEDVHRKSIQPMTRDNYPVRIELCLGDFVESTGYSPQLLVDAACLEAQNIDYNHPYYFAQCNPAAGKE